MRQPWAWGRGGRNICRGEFGGGKKGREGGFLTLLFFMANVCVVSFLGYGAGWDQVLVHGLPQKVPGGIPGRVRVPRGDRGRQGGDLGDLSQVIFVYFLFFL